MKSVGSGHFWKVFASVMLAAVLFGVFLWTAPLGDVGRTLARIKLGWVVASVAVALGTYALRALRWGLILRPVGRAGTANVMGCTAAGFATSTILPARAGEIVRPLLLTARTGMPAAATLASILTERLLDGATVLVLFGAGVVFVGGGLNAATLPLLRDTALLTTLGLAAAVTLVWFLLRRREGTVRRVASWFPARFRDRAISFLHHLLDGLEVLRSPRRLLEIAAWSLGLWIVIGWQLVLLGKAFDLDLSLGQAFVVVAVSVIGLAVPAPAGVGGFHWAIRFGLTQLLGVEVSTSTAYALIHHAICFFPITVLGLAYLAVVGVSLGKVRALETQAGAAPEGPAT
ncbi:MAG TPA: lysylphosphatidylglycerol synthase transmembrane domain-containing protein [Thermoanaerobaculaceae bacterium]|nr:lysylphosphatidylglycerol synthase transmembrane domain-containing protein [Thermoanaerobaculaceae bacterium]